MNNRVVNNTKVSHGIDMLHSHCQTLNAYSWVKASGKRYVIAKDENGRHYLDFRKLSDGAQ